MIFPSTSELLACIEGNLVRKVEPAVSDPKALSAVATIKHLLRLLGERVRNEGQILCDDIAALRELLPDLAAHFAGTSLAAQIEAALKPDSAGSGDYRNLDSLAAEANRLREALHAVAATVHTADSAVLSRHEGVRAKIKTYILHEIAEETRLIDPAFTGRGPRR
jgi:hypothetical protein